MADLVTRLRLDDKQFNDNIRKSKEQLNGFKNVGDKASAVFTAFSSVVASMATTMATLDKALNSTASTQLEYQSSLNAAKDSVNSFFTALTSGDWSIFEQGITTAINKAKEYNKAMIEAQRASQLNASEAEQLEAKRNYQEAIIKSGAYSIDEKNAAFNEYQNLAGQEKAVHERNIQVNKESLDSLLEANGLKGVIPDAEALQKAMWTYGNASTEEYKQLKAYERQKQQAAANKSQNMQAAALSGMTGVGNPDEYVQKAKSSTFVVDKTLDAYLRLLNIMADEGKLSTINEAISQISYSTDRIGTIEKDLQGATDDIATARKGGSGSPIGSTTRTAKTVDPQELLTWNIEGWINEEIKGLHNPLRKAIESGEKIPIKSLPIEIEDEVIEELPIPSLDNGITKLGLNMAESMNLAGQAMYGLGSAFQAFSENAAVGKAGLILGAIGQLVMGYATATAQAAKLGPFAWIGFAATGLGVLATTISAIKGYAEGGIVDSPYTVGDKNIIRVNGGEMVLTRAQQTNLFKMISGGSGINGGGNVTFTIKGKELVGVLSNYNNKVNKVL